MRTAGDEVKSCGSIGGASSLDAQNARLPLASLTRARAPANRESALPFFQPSRKTGKNHPANTPHQFSAKAPSPLTMRVRANSARLACPRAQSKTIKFLGKRSRADRAHPIPARTRENPIYRFFSRPRNLEKNIPANAASGSCTKSEPALGTPSRSIAPPLTRAKTIKAVWKTNRAWIVPTDCAPHTRNTNLRGGKKRDSRTAPSRARAEHATRTRRAPRKNIKVVWKTDRAQIVRTDSCQRGQKLAPPCPENFSGTKDERVSLLSMRWRRCSGIVLNRYAFCRSVRVSRESKYRTVDAVILLRHRQHSLENLHAIWYRLVFKSDL